MLTDQLQQGHYMCMQDNIIGYTRLLNTQVLHKKMQDNNGL